MNQEIETITSKEIVKITGMKRETLYSTSAKGHKYHDTKVGYGIYDKKKFFKKYFSNVYSETPKSILGEMLVEYLVSIGVKKVTMADALNVHPTTFNAKNGNFRLHRRIVDRYLEEHKEAFRKSEFNYNEDLENYEENEEKLVC